jgi:hypothetical protein
MKRSADQFDRLILRAVCEDIAPFEVILKNLREHLDQEEQQQVAERLLGLIASGMVDSYLLHTEPPHLTPVDTDAEGIYQHWFFISDEGMNHLNRLRPLSREWKMPAVVDRRSRYRCDLRSGKSVGC